MADLASGSIFAGRYQILARLGAGGMGQVYSAVHTEIERRVAIKVLAQRLTRDPEMLARFRMEARAAALVGHPGIIDVLDAGTTDDGAPYIVMELLEGESLGTRFKREGTLSVDETVKIAAEVLDALAAVHEKGIVHRDLKPENIYLAARPVHRAKLLDFGIAKFRGHESDEMAVTRTGQVIGTPIYMSPEQLKGAKEAGPPADLWALGVIMYESLTGQPPFLAETYASVIAKILGETPRPVREMRPDVSEELSKLISSLLAKAPQDRPADARAIHATLASSAAPTLDEGLLDTLPRPAASSEPIAVAPPPPEPPRDTIGDTTPDPVRPRNRIAIGIGAAIVAGIVIALATHREDPVTKAPEPSPAPVRTATVAPHPPPAKVEPPPPAKVEPQPLPPPPSKKSVPRLQAPTKTAPPQKELEIDRSNPFTQ